MKASAFLNLPMQSRMLRIIDLHAIDTEVVFICLRVLGVNQGQGDERAAVVLPRSQYGQFI